MWIENNYRRNLMDMHIDDWNPEFLSKLDVNGYVDALKDAGVQTAMIKAKPHTGLCYYPTKIGRMHKGLKGFDFLGKMCYNKENMIVYGYKLNFFYTTQVSVRVICRNFYFPEREMWTKDWEGFFV